jgi:hypothetical protein
VPSSSAIINELTRSLPLLSSITESRGRAFGSDHHLFYVGHMNIWRDLMNFHHGVHEALDTLKCEDLDGSAVRSPDALCHTWPMARARSSGATHGIMSSVVCATLLICQCRLAEASRFRPSRRWLQFRFSYWFSWLGHRSDRLFASVIDTSKRLVPAL